MRNCHTRGKKHLNTSLFTKEVSIKLALKEYIKENTKEGERKNIN